MNLLRAKTLIAFFILFQVGDALTLHAKDGMPRGARLIAEGVGTRFRELASLAPDGSAVAYFKGDRICLRRFQADSEPVVATMRVPSPIREANARSHEIRWVITGWEPAGQAVLFAVVHSRSQLTASKTYLFNPEGELKVLASTEGQHQRWGNCHLTRDGKFLVFLSKARPLIWDVNSNQPKATPFLRLVPSSSSRRWIGIEKDTRELVYVNKPWDDVERTPFSFPKYRHGDVLCWSPDERFILLAKPSPSRHHLPHSSKSVWLDLKSEERYEFDPASSHYDVFRFTNRRGEFSVLGIANLGHADPSLPGFYVEFKDPPIEPMERYWRWELRHWGGQRVHPVCNHGSTCFAFVDDQTSEMVMIDRDKQRTTFQLPRGHFPRILGFVRGDRELLVQSNDSLWLYEVPQEETK